MATIISPPEDSEKKKIMLLFGVRCKFSKKMPEDGTVLDNLTSSATRVLDHFWVYHNQSASALNTL